jgi:5,6-dimethylbenzimidazole synthase
LSLPDFDADFYAKLVELFSWRRDVRRFLTEPLPEGLLEELLALACMAPSVGLSEPWRFVVVRSPERRARVKSNFEKANQEALKGYQGEQARLYASLKLAGLDQAPAQVAVFCDEGTSQGSGLGRATMPEMAAYSVVTAVQTLWLAARARGIGLGWVSILDPAELCRSLEAPESWKLVAYLCLGYPEEQGQVPELSKAGWEKRRPPEKFVSER